MSHYDHTLGPSWPEGVVIMAHYRDQLSRVRPSIGLCEQIRTDPPSLTILRPAPSASLWMSVLLFEGGLWRDTREAVGLYMFSLAPHPRANLARGCGGKENL